MKKIKVKPLAFESLGVRSMATFISTPDVNILIDPGVAIAPQRYSLPPTKEEFEELRKLRKTIQEYSKKADIVTISHYHYDHYTPFIENIYCASNENYAKEIYKNKTLLIKHPDKNINKNQKQRARHFLMNVKNIANEIKYADNNIFSFNNTIIEFSFPAPHGEDNTKLGYITMCLIKYEDESILHTSDIQGPISEKTLNWIIEKNPTMIILGGPPSYLSWKFGKKGIKKVEENILKIIDKTDVELIILDHHLLRDEKYKEKLPIVFSEKKVVTAAKFLGQEEKLLEAKRKYTKNI